MWHVPWEQACQGQLMRPETRSLESGVRTVYMTQCRRGIIQALPTYLPTYHTSRIRILLTSSKLLPPFQTDTIKGWLTPCLFLRGERVGGWNPQTPWRLVDFNHHAWAVWKVAAEVDLQSKTAIWISFQSSTPEPYCHPGTPFISPLQGIMTPRWCAPRRTQIGYLVLNVKVKRPCLQRHAALEVG